MTTWKKTETGYELETNKGLVVLSKAGKSWSMVVGDAPVAIELGRKATFDTAERELRAIGVSW